MLDKVKSWNPPTKDHEKLKEFMIDELIESMENDCGEYPEECVYDFEEWCSYIKRKEKELVNYLEYSKKELKKREKQCIEKNLWIKALVDSLEGKRIPKKGEKKHLYKTNKAAKVGELIECPVCHNAFTKRQYSQAFCCSKCKDKFHNMHNKDRHKYMTDYDDNDGYTDREADEEYGVAEYND